MLRQIVRVSGAWDGQDPSNEGWHVSTYYRNSAGYLCEGDDSAKIWFPVFVDKYSRDERADLIAALALEFDCAEIEVES